MGYDSLYFPDEVHSCVHLVIKISCVDYFYPLREFLCSLLHALVLPSTTFPSGGDLSACQCHDIRRIYNPLTCLRGTSSL